MSTAAIRPSSIVSRPGATASSRTRWPRTSRSPESARMRAQRRRIEVQPEVLGVDDLEQPSPDGRRVGEVLAARPFVGRKDHWAVLDDDRHAMLARKASEIGPDLADFLEVVGDRPVLVATDERPDEPDAEGLGGQDDLAQVVVRVGAHLGVGIEVVRVVGQRADLEAVPLEQLPDLLRTRLVELVDVDVTHARVTTAIAGQHRPARDLERLESLARGPPRQLLQVEAFQGGRHQPELHSAVTPCGVAAATPEREDCRSTSTQRAARALSATASPTSISSWPSANVAYGGSETGAPARTSV